MAGESRTSGAQKPPDFTWFASAPALVSDPEATKATVAAFSEHFGAQRILPMPQVNASEDVGVFGEALGVPTVFWFWGGLETEPTVAAFAEGRMDELPGNHSALFAPVIEPTLSTGVEALVVAAMTWLGKA